MADAKVWGCRLLSIPPIPYQIDGTRSAYTATPKLGSHTKSGFPRSWKIRKILEKKVVLESHRKLVESMPESM